MKSSSFSDFFYRWTLYLALAVALTATLGSLYFSQVRHYLPCDLCWYQRICMYPLVVILAVGLLRQSRDIAYFVLPLSLIGQGIATYHYLLEKTNIFASPTSCQVGVPCTTPWINWLGFITIPFLAMMGFFLITIFCLIAMTSGEPEEEELEQTPWFPVASVFVVVALGFVLFYLIDPVREPTLTLTTPVVGEMSPVNATATPPPLSQEVAGSAGITESNPLSKPDAGPGDVALGRQLYTATCSACHGVDAKGLPNLGTSLVESPIIHEQSSEEALAFIRKGRLATDPDSTTGMSMPPSGAHPELTDDEILAIVAFLLQQ